VEMVGYQDPIPSSSYNSHTTPSDICCLNFKQKQAI